MDKKGDSKVIKLIHFHEMPPHKDLVISEYTKKETINCLRNIADNLESRYLKPRFRRWKDD